MPVTSLSPLISMKCYAADIFMFRLDRIGLFRCCFTKLIGNWMADYINFLSVALQINTVSCYELKRVGTGSIGSEGKGVAWIADSFSFLSNRLVMSFFYFIAIKILWHSPLLHFSAICVDPAGPHWRTGYREVGRVIQSQDPPPFASRCLCFLLRAMLVGFKNMKNVSHWYFQML